MNKRKRKSINIQAYSALGDFLIFAGASIMAICAVWELAVRIDAMDGGYKLFFNLVKDADVPFSVAFKTFFRTEESLKDLTRLLYLAATGVFSIIAIFARKKKLACLLMLPAYAYILINEAGNDSVLQILNLFNTVRIICTSAILAGACLNIARFIYVWYAKRQRKRARAKKKKNKAKTPVVQRIPLAHGTYKTLIPRNEMVARSKNVGRNG